MLTTDSVLASGLSGHGTEYAELTICGYPYWFEGTSIIMRFFLWAEARGIKPRELGYNGIAKSPSFRDPRGYDPKPDGSCHRAFSFYHFGFRFPRPCRLVVRGYFRLAGSDQFRIRQALADDLTDSEVEPIRIGHRLTLGILPVVKTERLFVNIPEQVVRLDRYVGAVNTALLVNAEVAETAAAAQ